MEEQTEARRYYVDLEASKASGRSVSSVIAARKCYADRQEDTPEPLMTSPPKGHMKRISVHCADTPDYLLPDTALKEAIFRVLLAGNNQPTTAQEISESLMKRWALNANRRDISPRVIQRLLENSLSYDIVAEPEPEPEEVSEEGQVEAEAAQGGDQAADAEEEPPSEE